MRGGRRGARRGAERRANGRLPRRADIRANEASKAELEADLRRIAMERELHTVRLQRNREWAAQFDKDIGPFSSQYDGLAHGIGTLYEAAKAKHARAVQVLVDEFDYHPAFRNKPDAFFAIPFRPK